ncbi:hypothetical protein BT93_A2065 [Corymbia citriodora subsp. variegata]|nr:hypothetical protein BT93_A2065 [Corymbia citriodora subsp. variegata]
MAEASVHGAIHRGSSGDRPNRDKRNRSPLPPSDRISALPDAVIHHIFSFLPLKDVVKTSVLSKRWRSTWTATAHLVFPNVRPRDHKRWPSLVENVLLRCASPQVKRFDIAHFRYDEAHHPRVDIWLRFAEKRRVEDLHLGFYNPLKVYYKLPRSLYCLSRLVRLQVSQCCFSLGTSVRWPCLKFLLIKFSELSDDSLAAICRGSPVLESLELQSCRGVTNIVIDSTSVKELVLVHPNFLNTGKIWAPHLLSLRVLGMWHSRSIFKLDEISSLVEAELDFGACGDKRMLCDLLKELFEELRGVSTITIGGRGRWCLQVLFLLKMEGVPSPLSKCQNLTLNAPVSQWNFPGIACLLRSSHCLEKLVIHLTGVPQLEFQLDEESQDHFNFDEEEFLCSRKGNFEHLRRIEITGSGADSFGSKHLLALIKFLLGNALVLKKLIIKAQLPTRHGQKRLQAAVLSKLLGVSRNVLNYQRASKDAEVIFDYPFKEMSF